MEEQLIDPKWFRKTDHGYFLLGSKCEQCGKYFFPRKKVCLSCFDGQLTDVSLSRKGTLHTYAISHLGIDGIETPYALGFIDLPEKIKLFSVLTDCEPWDEKLKVGMEMEMVMSVIKRNYDQDIISYKFRPAKES